VGAGPRHQRRAACGFESAGRGQSAGSGGACRRGGVAALPAPPIATLLVGLGLVGLLRTSPSPSDYANAEDVFDPGRWPRRASALADSAKRKAEEWGAQASEAARDAKAQVAETAASMAERASGALRDAGDTAREGLGDAGDAARARMTRFADDAAAMSDQASARMRAVMPDRDDRDNILLGAAALAVAAAVGIAVQRRAHEEM
jgi:hypothetical protein